jgi:hypothetical protein
VRALRDRSELFEGADNVIKLGPHRFFVNTQPLELSIVPRDGGLAVHLTGTDFFEPSTTPPAHEREGPLGPEPPQRDPGASTAGSSSPTDAARGRAGDRGLTLSRLREDALTRRRSWRRCARVPPSATTRATSAACTTSTPRHPRALVGAPPHRGHAAPRRPRPRPRRAARSSAPRRGRPRRSSPAVAAARGASSRSRARPARGRARRRAHPLPSRRRRRSWGSPPTPPDERVRAARYLVEELGAEPRALRPLGRGRGAPRGLLQQLQEDGARSPFEDDLRALEPTPPSASPWPALAGGLRGADPRTRAAFGASARWPWSPTDASSARPAAAVLEARVEGLLGSTRASTSGR